MEVGRSAPAPVLLAGAGTLRNDGRGDRGVPPVIYQAPRTSDPHPDHRICPYLLRGLVIDRANQVCCTDIT